MSIRNIRRSVLVLASAAAIAVGGLIAGRLAATVVPDASAGEHFAPHVFRRLAKQLDLTADQTAKIKAVLKTHAAEIEAQMTSSSDARKALRDAVVAQPLDENGIRARASDLGRVHGDGAILFARIHAEIDPILTADQRTKLQAIHARMSQRGTRARQAFEKFLNEGAD